MRTKQKNRSLIKTKRVGARVKESTLKKILLVGEGNKSKGIDRLAENGEVRHVVNNSLMAINNALKRYEKTKDEKYMDMIKRQLLKLEEFAKEKK